MNKRIKTPRHRRQANPTVNEHLADLWARAIEYDGIDPTATTVVFTGDNQYAVAYSRVMGAAVTKGGARG